MLKRDEISGQPGSCLAKARDDEMLFILLGRDKAAPAAIRAWVQERIRLGLNKNSDMQILEAEECARKMCQTQSRAPNDARIC